jgi:hypothetical protein
VSVPPLDPRALGELVTAVPAGESVEALARLCVRDGDGVFPSGASSDVGYAVIRSDGVILAATGRAVEDAVVGVRPSAAAPMRWTRITTCPVPDPDGTTAGAAFLVLIRPVEWARDPSGS